MKTNLVHFLSLSTTALQLTRKSFAFWFFRTTTTRVGFLGLQLLAMMFLSVKTRAASAPALGVNADQAPIEDSVIFSRTNGMIGWTFFVTEPIVVTGLGWYDYGRDGLVDSHQIGIWKELSGLGRDQLFYGLTNMSLLVSATIAAGTEAPLTGPWRTVGIPSLTLQPGGYEIAGTFTSDPGDIFKFASVAAGDLILPDARIEVSAPTSYFGDGFQAPEQGALYYGVHLGPMFLLEVPEPACLQLVSVAMLMLWCRTRSHQGGSARLRHG